MRCRRFLARVCAASRTRPTRIWRGRGATSCCRRLPIRVVWVIGLVMARVDWRCVMLFPGRRRYESVDTVNSSPEVDGVAMGAAVGGDAARDIVARGWYWLRGEWTRHSLVLGAPGSGKSETALRMAFGLAAAIWRGLSVQVFYFDAK